MIPFVKHTQCTIRHCTSSLYSVPFFLVSPTVIVFKDIHQYFSWDWTIGASLNFIRSWVDIATLGVGMQESFRMSSRHFLRSYLEFWTCVATLSYGLPASCGLASLALDSFSVFMDHTISGIYFCCQTAISVLAVSGKSASAPCINTGK
jgi:hypothetical protein